jgi:hypothetical protein
MECICTEMKKQSENSQYISCQPSQNQQATYKADSEMNMHLVNENTN